MTTAAPWGRRDFLGAAALLALCVGVPVATVQLTRVADDEAPTDRQRTIMAEVADLVIPRTDTPGGRDVGAGDFAILALAHGLSATRAPVASGAITPAIATFLRPDGSLRHVDWLERTLDQAGRGDFMRRSLSERAEILAAIDATAMARGAPWLPWVAIKGLILTGYYTTEAGGSQELRYQLVPGRFDPDLPLLADDRAWSSDWTAVEFG
ncbi:gluconate 2-dehydrogenase subunit 3 family protein [Sphingomonas sp.]|uniref:gluconate 2-dehydrogenase subunit 3 family protein n=1 Tax=Sphingomonas sp. TaxID=28214 RepID=UPI003BAC9ABB